ncbi:MAG TPA: hypothetical protein VFF74_05640 [Methylophilaceae bacterium]|nr:hypothetical protein [Methylophilaceae bacterium]
MSDIDEFEKLECTWFEARQAATNAQIAIDLKMRHFLSGKGSVPPRGELEYLENLRSKEAEAYDALDRFISERIPELRLLKR